MFRTIYGKRMLSELRRRDTLIWTWVFPILLATLFYVTFANLDIADQFTEIPLGVVDDEAYRGDEALQMALASVSGTGDSTLFDLHLLADTTAADTALASGEIDGYILAGTPPTLRVADDGTNQTIAKSFLDRFVQTQSAVITLLTEDPSAALRLSELVSPVTYTETAALTENPPTKKVNYFYALLAMVCLYGGFQGLTTVSGLQPNLSALGARRTLSPLGRFRTVAYDLLGGLTVHFICVLLVVCYIIFVLGIDFGPKLGLVLLTCLAGSVLGVSFGAVVSVSSKLKEQAKVAVLISVTMICCFLSGLMVSGINYVIAEKAPVVAWLNPAARIVDAFYCLYYYDTFDRYFLNLGVILVMTLVMLAVTAFFVRRKQYESI